MRFGKTIRLFLVEGSINGLVTAELSNWTGKAFKIPRIKIKEYANRDEFKKAGLYILFGKNENDEDAAYIGEGEPIIERIKSHDIKKDFWNEAILFVSKDEYLNKASIKYLENRLHSIGVMVDRYDISSQNTPTRSSVSEAEMAELEEFLDNIKLLTSTLGHKIFEPLEESVKTDNGTESLFFCKNNTGIIAKGSPSVDGFLVYNGSQLVANFQTSLTESIRNERTKMVVEGILKQEKDTLILSRDYMFSSSSRAAAMILGRSARGPVEWKTERGMPLNQIEASISWT